MNQTPPATTRPAGLARLRDRLQGRVVSGSAWIMGGFVVQALTGVAFWVVAAQTYGADEVGTAAALFASIQFVIYATALGLPEMLSRHHQADRRMGGTLLMIAGATTVVASLIGAAVYLTLVDPTGAEDLARFGFPTLVFGLLCAGNALALLVDVELTASRRWRVVSGRLVATGLIRIPLALVPLVDPVSIRLLLANAGPLALSGFLGIALVPRLTGRRLRPRWRPPFSPILRYTVVSYASQLAYLAPQFVVPVIVLTNVSPSQNANFFIAWTFTMLMWVLPFTISRVLLTESGHDDVSLVDETRRAVLFAVGLATAALLAGLAARPLILWMFGPLYEDTLHYLPLLLAGGVPAAVTTVLLGFARARDDTPASVAIPLVLAVTTVGIALATVPDHGADGATLAWLIGNSAAALVAVALVVPRRTAGRILRRQPRTT